jgi:MFS family permease
MGLERYLDLLRAPGAAPLLAAAAVGRLPYGMNVLALILLLRAQGVAYAEVGVITGASGLAVGATAPFVGRLVDRLGQTRVLVPTACLCFAAGVGLTVAATEGAGVPALVALAILAGGATPPVSPCMRALWPRLVERDRLDTAFAFDALQLEVFFILGPLIAAGLATWISPEVAFPTGVAMQAAGALWFAAASASRRWRPEREPAGRRRSALASPGLRTLVGALALVALSLGILEIGIAAFAEEESSRSDSGWLFALWGLGSLAGGLWYGARRWRSGPVRRFLIVSAALAAGLAPLPFAETLPVFAAFVVVAGLGLAPSTAAGYALIGELAPEGSLTEAYAWQIVAYVAGSAIGAWLAGILVDEAGVATALACAPVAAGLGLLVALSRRRTLRPLPVRGG